jgi:hypothetical protein
MTELPEILDLEPQEEARRLWKGAIDARGRAREDLVALFQVLDLGLRAAEILVLERLSPIRNQFPATIALQLERPRPEVDTVEDATTVPHSLQFTEILDLLSREDLECVAPGLHRGWEDRRFSCRRSRVTAQGTLEVCLQEGERKDLLLLSAYRNRIFRAPPPVRVAPREILAAFDSLEELIQKLF